MQKNIDLIFAFIALGILAGCSTLTDDNKTHADPLYQEQRYSKDRESVMREIDLTVQLMERNFTLIKRDIDSPQWINNFINHSASKDLYYIEMIHRTLKYQPWPKEVKYSFVDAYLNSSDGILKAKRQEIFSEVKYLVEYSHLLQEYPWLTKTQFDPISEFSYWYLMYIFESIDPMWVETQILPAMLKLIPLDEITPVTYLWIKAPDSLSEMDSEINSAGYPWTIIFHLIRVNKELFKMIEEIYGKDNSPLKDRTGIFL